MFEGVTRTAHKGSLKSREVKKKWKKDGILIEIETDKSILGDEKCDQHKVERSK